MLSTILLTFNRGRLLFVMLSFVIVCYFVGPSEV